MNILHLCLAGPFSEGYTYQENLLTTYHSRMGHKVSVITSNWALDNVGVLRQESPKLYTNKDNVSVYRIKLKGEKNFLRKIKRHEDYSDILRDINPDIIFIHGSQFFDIKPIMNYKILKKEKVKIFIDNHADFSNSATNIFSREILHKILWRNRTLSLLPYVHKFYGVLPARVEFLTEIYKVPKNKVELLNMGGDDELVKKYSNINKEIIREKYGVPKNKVLLVTGGKIDNAKKEVLFLLDYVEKKQDVFLIIFGSVSVDIKQKFDSLLNENTKYLGWVNTEESYEIFSIADLVVFPGRHSVYWEQAVSQKKPMLVKEWKGTNHIDIGGNISFVNFSFEEKNKLFDELDSILLTSKLFDMTKNAKKNKSQLFLYSNIAERSIKE